MRYRPKEEVLEKKEENVCEVKICEDISESSLPELEDEGSNIKTSGQNSHNNANNDTSICQFNLNK